jgi:hypothetical protein
MLWGKFRLVSYRQKLPKTPVGVLLCITTPGYVRHNSRLWRVGKKSMVITRQSMVITRQGGDTPAKNATSISGNSNGGERQLLFMLISP